MIEEILLDYLSEMLDEPVYMEKPKPAPDAYVVIDKTGSSRADRIETATFAIQSYAQSLYEAAKLNEKVKSAMETMPDSVSAVFRAALNSDSNFSDMRTKERRYQAVYHITYKEATT